MHARQFPLMINLHNPLLNNTCTTIAACACVDHEQSLIGCGVGLLVLVIVALTTSGIKLIDFDLPCTLITTSFEYFGAQLYGRSPRRCRFFLGPHRELLEGQQRRRHLWRGRRHIQEGPLRVSYMSGSWFTRQNSAGGCICTY